MIGALTSTRATILWLRTLTQNKDLRFCFVVAHQNGMVLPHSRVDSAGNEILALKLSAAPISAGNRPLALRVILVAMLLSHTRLATSTARERRPVEYSMHHSLIGRSEATMDRLCVAWFLDRVLRLVYGPRRLALCCPAPWIALRQIVQLEEG